MCCLYVCGKCDSVPFLGFFYEYKEQHLFEIEQIFCNIMNVLKIEVKKNIFDVDNSRKIYFSYIVRFEFEERLLNDQVYMEFGVCISHVF